MRPNGDAIQVSGSTNVLIEENSIENTGEGVFCQHVRMPPTASRGCVVRDNVIRSLGANGRCVAPGVPDACCTGDRTGDGRFGVPGSSLCAPGQPLGPAIGMLSDGGAIADNVVNGHWFIGVGALVALADMPTSGITVSGNTLTSVDVGSGNGAISITTDGPAVRDVRVTENHVVGTDDSGVLLRIDGARGTIGDVTVADNTIVSSCRVEQSCASVFLDRIASAASFANIAIDRNDLAGGGRYGFWLEGTTVNVAARDNLVGPHAAGPFNFAAPATFAEYTRNSPVTVRQLDLLGRSGIGDGSRQSCSDCRSTDRCSGRGKGALAFRAAGIWKCRLRWLTGS